MESPGFLLAIFALAVVSYGAERSLANAPPERRRPVSLGLGVLGVIIGALLFAGTLAGGDETSWPGIVAGAACAALAWVAVGALIDRARGRLQGSAVGLLSVYADVVALALAALAIFVEPVAYVALAAFVLMAVQGRRGGDEKYAGLRVLR